MRLLPLASALLLAFVSTAPLAQSRIETRLTPEQMQATGLSRLTAAELAELNRILDGEAREAERVVETRVREAKRAPEVATSSILPGPFNGWAPGVTLTLANGEKWRVTEGTLVVTPGRRSDVPVKVAPGFLGAWYLKAEGEVPQAKVKRID